MDVIDEKKIADLVVTPALGKIRTETIPALQSAVNVELSLAIEKLEAVITSAFVDVHGVLDKTIRDLNTTIAGLDGWTLEVSVPPIQIGPLIVKLSKPRQ
jgi:hypothetical protein